jgi:uncharacterized protein
MSSFPLNLAPAPDPISRQIVSFDGARIHYDIHDASSRSLVVVVPGFWRDRRHPSMLRLASMLRRFGHRSAIVDVRGHGASEGTYGFNLHEHHDIAAVINDLASQLSFDSVTLLGLSYGGAIAVTTAARHDLPIGSLLLISAVADPAMISPRLNPFFIHRHIAVGQALRRPRFDWRMKPGSRLRAVDDIGEVHVPLCLIHVKDDWLITHRHSLALYEAAKEPKDLHILDVAGNYHADRIFSIAPDSVEPIVRDFIGRHSTP